MTKLNGWKTGCVLLILIAATVVSAQAQTFTLLSSLNGRDGAYPQAGLIQGADGNLYGTSEEGGTISSPNCPNGCGTVFRITPSGNIQRLYSFCEQGSECLDGAYPLAGLLQASDGNLYGTTAYGGGSSNCNGGCGTVFKFSQRGVLTTLHSFVGDDGSTPLAPLIQATDGNLYGTTAGTVFKITLSGTMTVLHFGLGAGTNSISALLEADNGNFYGEASAGGLGGTYCPPDGCGTVFTITPQGALTTLYYFTGKDGSTPIGALIQTTKGILYGTTDWGGANGLGTVFKMTTRGELTTIHSFDSDDGSNPNAGLVQASDGNFYGTTFYGGTRGTEGTAFQITVDGALTTEYDFCSLPGCADGAYPLAPVVQDTGGALYGVSSVGGKKVCNYGCGVVFCLNAGLGPFVTFVLSAGKVGQTGGILGQGFTGTTSVMLNGISANFKVVSDTFIKATVPSGATTGYVTVTTPTGVLKSNVPFRVIR